MTEQDPLRLRHLPLQEEETDYAKVSVKRELAQGPYRDPSTIPRTDVTTLNRLVPAERQIRRVLIRREDAQKRAAGRHAHRRADCCEPCFIAEQQAGDTVVVLDSDRQFPI